MRYLLFLIIILAVATFGCQKSKQMNFETYFSNLKNSNFKEKYIGYENVYRRNCMFSFLSPDSIHLTYRIINDHVSFIESSGSLKDSVWMEQEIKEVLVTQHKYGISGFISSKNKFVAYFNLKNIEYLPVAITDDEKKKYYGALMYYYTDFKNNELFVKLHNGLNSVSVDSNWYFYLSPAPINFDDCK